MIEIEKTYIKYKENDFQKKPYFPFSQPLSSIDL